jgi:NAD(P)-dependent dehydrogenase (short-subunit alcohol dehydrogenase family)
MGRDFVGKVAFITGAAHGQGRAVALALARAGAAVAGFDIARTLDYPGYALGSNQELGTLRDEIAAFGGRFLPLVGDVRDEAAVASAVSDTVAAFGGLDIVFGNAGVAAYGLVVDLTEAQWDTVLDINLKGNFLLAKHATPHLVARGGGVIIFNSSVAGLRGFARLAHYSASKWGLVGLAKSLAIEVAKHKVRVVTLHPTGVDTPLNDGLAELEGSTALEIAERSAGNLLPTPWVTVEDVVASVLFLASDDARFLTGSALVLDAGLLTR